MLRQALVFLMIIVSSTGCGTFRMPPTGIPAARNDYLEAINNSWKEQLLSNLVKLQNGDSLTFLDMSQVSTSYLANYAIGVAYSYGWGAIPGTNNLGWVPTNKVNAVTPQIGVSYQVSPTVSYAAIKGDNLRNVMMEPIPLVTVLKSLQAAWDAEHIIPLTIESVNNISSASLERNPRNEIFNFAQLFQDLLTRGIIRIDIEDETIAKTTNIQNTTTTPGDFTPTERDIDTCKNTPVTEKELPTTLKTVTTTITENFPPCYLILAKYDPRLSTFIKLILPNPSSLPPSPFPLRYRIRYGNRPSKPVKNPVNHDDNVAGEIFIQTRSIMQILVLLSQCNNYGTMSGIIESATPPLKDAFVSVRYRNHWFYIDDNDKDFKKYFSSTVIIWSMFEPTAIVTPGGGAGGGAGGTTAVQAAGSAGTAAASVVPKPCLTPSTGTGTKTTSGGTR